MAARRSRPILPPALRPGDRVAVVAPSGPVDREALRRGIEVLQARYDVECGPAVWAERGFLAGDDAQRLRALEHALDDPAIRAIFVARGGHGLLRIADRISLARLRRRPKVVVGYSDVTVLHALLARAGIASVHGPIVQALASAGEIDRRAVFDLVEHGEPPAAVESLEVWSTGSARGRLYGGNLAILAHLQGIDRLPPSRGAIWVIEEINEPPYRVDRTLTQLRIGGALAGLGGIVVGSFSGCEPQERDGVTVVEVLREQLSRLGVPVLAGLPVGHGERNLALPLGARVELDGRRGRLVFLDPAVRSSRPGGVPS